MLKPATRAGFIVLVLRTGRLRGFVTHIPVPQYFQKPIKAKCPNKYPAFTLPTQAQIRVTK